MLPTLRGPSLSAYRIIRRLGSFMALHMVPTNSSISFLSVTTSSVLNLAPMLLSAGSLVPQLLVLTL